MTWTTDTPTEPGWYFWRDDADCLEDAWNPLYLSEDGWENSDGTTRAMKAWLGRRPRPDVRAGTSRATAAHRAAWTPALTGMGVDDNG